MRGERLGAATQRAIDAARSNPQLLIVLAAGALLRLAVGVAYHPAVFYNDSFVYLRHAVNAGGTGIVAFAPDRPAGYPLVLNILGVDLESVTNLQHLAGLTGGVLLYALMRHLGVGRWPAAIAAGIVLLDAYAVTLEQLILAEGLFTAAIVAGATLVVLGRRWPVLAAGGASLAAACLLRNTGYMFIPAVLAYLVVRHRRDWLPLAAVVAGLAVPFAAYAGWQHATIGKWKPVATTASGWFLYSRVAEFGDCQGVDVPALARPLCSSTPQDAGQGPEYFLFTGGPARRMFPDAYPGGGGQDPVLVNHILREYAIAVIKARPVRYTRAAVGDLLKFFRPGAAAYGDDDDTILLQDIGPTTSGVDGRPTAPYYYNGGTPAAGHPKSPGGLVLAYQQVFHTPRWLLALCALAALGAAVLRRTARGRGLPARPEQIVLIGGPLLALFGQAATAQFAIRYELPFAGLLIAGGAVALSDLLTLVDRDPLRAAATRLRAVAPR